MSVYRWVTWVTSGREEPGAPGRHGWSGRRVGSVELADGETWAGPWEPMAVHVSALGEQWYCRRPVGKASEP